MANEAGVPVTVLPPGDASGGSARDRLRQRMVQSGAAQTEKHFLSEVVRMPVGDLPLITARVTVAKTDATETAGANGKATEKTRGDVTLKYGLMIGTVFYWERLYLAIAPFVDPTLNAEIGEAFERLAIRAEKDPIFVRLLSA